MTIFGKEGGVLSYRKIESLLEVDIRGAAAFDTDFVAQQVFLMFPYKQSMIVTDNQSVR